MTQNKRVGALKNVLALIIIIFIICSCTPQQRLNRLLKKHPELMAKDTLIVLDTLIIKESKFDTIFKVTDKTDTFYISNEKIKIQIIKKDSIIKVNYFIPSDTIIKKIIVPVEKIKEIKENFNKIYWFAAGFLVMLLLLFGIKKLT